MLQPGMLSLMLVASCCYVGISRFFFCVMCFNVED